MAGTGSCDVFGAGVGGWGVAQVMFTAVDEEGCDGTYMVG